MGIADNGIYSNDGKLYAGMTLASLRADIKAMHFQSDEEREKAYNKQIQLFNYANSLIPEEADDLISEKEIEAYNKKEKNKKIWKTAGVVAAGIGITVAAIALRKYHINKAKNSLGKILPIESATEGSEISEIYREGCKFFDIEKTRFVDEINPKMLEKKIIPANEKTIFVSNFEYCKGTVAATTSLDRCIATDRVYQCAGLTIVDKSLNKQTLVHVYPWHSVEGNKMLIKEILSGSKPENLEISIIPGSEPETTSTVAFLADAIKELAPTSKVNFCNIPAIEPLPSILLEGRVHFYEGYSAIWLKDGKLFCCENWELPNKITNPREFLTYFH